MQEESDVLFGRPGTYLGEPSSWRGSAHCRVFAVCLVTNIIVGSAGKLIVIAVTSAKSANVS